MRTRSTWSRFPAAVVAFLLPAAIAEAQTEAKAPALPRLFALGASPAGTSELRLFADGRLEVGGRPRSLAQLDASALAGATAALAVDRMAPAALVGAVVDRLRGLGAREIAFSAELPTGARGAFRLALPPPVIAGAAAGPGHAAPAPVASDESADLVLTMTHARPGVAPDSAVPLLRRMAVGTPDQRLVLRVEVAGDTSFENTLQVLGALAQTGMCEASVAWQRTPRQVAAGTDLRALAGAEHVHQANAALDLGPVPAVQVQSVAVPQPKPNVAAAPLGLAAPSREAVDLPGGGAGGRYGGRGGAAARAPQVEVIAKGATWTQRTQQPDGRWRHGEDDARDVETTALVLLTQLADGRTLQTSPQLTRGIGWLLARQEEGRCIGRPGENAVRAHAMACYALVEAYGLSQCPLLRGGIEDALRWLAAQRNADGGFGNGAPGAPSDVQSTTWALVTFASARFFDLDGLPPPGDIAKWYDRAALDGGAFAVTAGAKGEDAASAVATAAALFGQFLAGRDPKEHAGMARSAQWLLDNAGPDDPQTAYWATYALYQMGGRHWATWSKRLAGLPEQVLAGPDAGSFAPAGGESRAITSALRVLTMQAYYRYTRLVR